MDAFFNILERLTNLLLKGMLVFFLVILVSFFYQAFLEIWFIH